jgi:hypothetical protein
MRDVFISNSFTLPDLTYGYLEEVRDIASWYFIEDAVPTSESVFILLDTHLLGDAQHINLMKIGKVSGIVFIRQVDANYIKPHVMVEKILHLVNVLGVDPHQIWLQLNCEHDKTYLVEKLKTFDIALDKVYVYSVWLDKVYNDYLKGKCILPSDEPKFKFSVFSRRFSEERFHLYCDLLSKNLLKDFTYTFANCHAETTPYPYTIITTNDMVDLAKNNGYLNQSIVAWIENMPYADLHDFDDPFTAGIYKQMSNAILNLIIETGITSDEVLDRTITEKTYKPIVLRKPFMVFGDKSVLTKLKNEGFRTFEPYIDESYAYLDENCLTEKISMISNELLRLANLTDSEFTELECKLQEIADYNFKRFIYLAETGIENIKSIKKNLQLSQ